MSHLALITTLQMTHGVILCLRTCACAVWQESHTVACSLDSTCNQFGAAQLLWCNVPWNVHMTSIQEGKSRTNPSEMCAKSHGQTNTASVLFSKIGSAQAVEVTWKCLPYRTPYGGSIALIMYSAMHTTWVMTADLNGSTMEYSSNSFKRSEYVKCKSHAMLFELNKQISNFPEWLIWHLGQWAILWSWLWPSEWIYKLIWKHVKRSRV